MPLKVSPTSPKDIIQFLLGVMAETTNRAVKTKLLSIDTAFKASGRNIQGIKIDFNSDYLTEDINHLQSEIAALMNVTRDWRIELGASGNFSSPYTTLATRMIGVHTTWQVQTTTGANDILRLYNSSSGNSFTMSVEKCSIHLRWFNK